MRTLLTSSRIYVGHINIFGRVGHSLTISCKKFKIISLKLNNNIYTTIVKMVQTTEFESMTACILQESIFKLNWKLKIMGIKLRLLHQVIKMNFIVVKEQFLVSILDLYITWTWVRKALTQLVSLFELKAQDTKIHGSNFYLPAHGGHWRNKRHMLL